MAEVHKGPGDLKHIRDDWKDEKYHYFPTGVIELPVLGESNNADLSHTIHVWYIYLHLVDLYGKCMGRYGYGNFEGFALQQCIVWVGVLY